MRYFMSVGARLGKINLQRFQSFIVIASVAIATLVTDVYSQVGQFSIRSHSNGQLRLNITNNGLFGINDTTYRDPLTGEEIIGSEYPGHSFIRYIDGGMMFGGITGADTLVSGYGWFEFNPSPSPAGDLALRSIDPTVSYYDTGAHAEIEYQTEFTDTMVYAPIFNISSFDSRLHIPLGLCVRQTSYSWSTPTTDDFVIIKYELSNISAATIHDGYVGFLFNVHPGSTHFEYPATDTLQSVVGYLEAAPSFEQCGLADTVQMVYGLSLDGRPHESSWDAGSPLGAAGIRILQQPEGSSRRNFNWSVGIAYHPDSVNAPKSWGPRRRGTEESPFRALGNGLAAPYGDANMYYVMSHPEFD